MLENDREYCYHRHVEWGGRDSKCNATTYKKTSFRLATNYYDIIIVVRVVSDLIARACGLQLIVRGWRLGQRATISINI